MTRVCFPALRSQHLTPTRQGPAPTSGLYRYSNICSIHSFIHTQTYKLKINLLKILCGDFLNFLIFMNLGIYRMSDILKTRSPLGDEKKPAPAPALTSMCSYHEGDSNHCYKQTLEFRFSPERLCTQHTSLACWPLPVVLQLCLCGQRKRGVSITLQVSPRAAVK